MDEPDVQPEFPGGQSAMIEFFKSNVKYPSTAIKNKVEGTVFVQFVVEKDGSISETEIRKGLQKDCNKEALRVIGEMPKWKSAMKAGKPVRCRFIVPVEFKLI